MWLGLDLFDAPKLRYLHACGDGGGAFICSIQCISVLNFLLNCSALLCCYCQDMSSEVVDSNPYSRLMALQRMGIVENYERIRDFSIAIVVCTLY